MARNAPPKEKSDRESLWDRFGRFVTKGPPIDTWDSDDDQQEDGEVKLKPGITYKGL